ncbi:KinB-signaling pathway activation protein [Radiobacillus sp. PE A8.2]|uniref:KinB-signaling pathway activation protein n=1 Tax=Radiobacillus sp. PE A8.2 TaxID=3380349 RepID=UPI00388E18DF
MFFRTLFLGAISAIITSFFVKTDSYTEYLQPINYFQLLGIVLFIIGLGLVFSLISQMGFFAYLTINQFGLGMFRGFWTPIQLLLIVVALFDLVYFRHRAADVEHSIVGYLLVAVALFVYSWIVAGIKAKQTNNKAFVPALFFMVVVTSIEWVPGLRTDGNDYVWMMIICLLVCNTYQLLLLHRITEKRPVTNEDAKK